MNTADPIGHRPNIVLLMCDDLGWGDTGFNGNTVIQTPCLDALRRRGARFQRFYAGGPVCSPTRGTCLTGRHYSRYGITHANVGHLPRQEYTIARMCRERGYRTGHFGKWHLGTLERSYSGKTGRDPARHFAPPWERDYDRSFATEYAVPTWDPGRAFDMRSYARSDDRWGSPYYCDGERVEDLLLGCDSRLIMDQALGFIRDSVASHSPFMTTIWFHAPHTPVEAGPDYHSLYAGSHSDEEAHYYGCITAMDEQVGRLVAELDRHGLADDTILFFCSDNGPEGLDDLQANGRSRGRTGGLRGRKRSLFDGGIGVPALAVWPGVVAPDSEILAPCSTLDYLPTLAGALDAPLPDRPYDGLDLGPLVRGETGSRPRPIPYRFLARRRSMHGSPTLALIDGSWKFLTNLGDPADDLLYDLAADRGETCDVRHREPDRAAAMRDGLSRFIASCRASHHGADYAEPEPPADPFQEPGDWLA